MTVPEGDTIINGVQSPLTTISKSILSTSPFLLLPLLLLTTPLITPAFAQQVVAPIPVSKVENTYVSDKALYIRGGLNAGSRVQQFYSLDLTPLLVHSNKLLWKYLNPAGPIQKFRDKMPMAITYHNQALTYFHESSVRADYNLQADRWDAVAAPICANGIPEYVKSLQTALVDPKTQLVYIPFGFAHEKQMLVLDMDKGTCTGVPMPTNSKADLFAWSDSKSTIYMVGTVPPATTPNVWEYQFATKTWKNIPKKGQPPTALILDSCMVSSLGGQKLLLFGGHNFAKATGDMFVFDTVSYNWTKAATSPNVRADMACASAGEYFVAWGGAISYLDNITPPEILFYNVKNDKWLNQTEIAPPLNATLPVPVSPTSTGSESINTGLPSAGASKNNGAVIGGGVAAGVVAIAAIIGFLLYRRRTKQARVKRDPQDLNIHSLPFLDNSNNSLPSTAHLNSRVESRVLLAPATAILDRDSNIKAEIQERERGEGYHPTHQGPQYQPSTGTTTLSEQQQSPLPISTAPQYISTGQEQEKFWRQQPLNSPHLPPPLQTLPFSPLSPQPPFQEMSPQRLQVQNSELPAGPLEQIALLQARYDQDMEQMRRDQQAALERVRQQWQEDLAAQAARESGSKL